MTLNTYKAKLRKGRKVIEITLRAKDYADATAQAQAKGAIVSLKKSTGDRGFAKLSVADRIILFQRLASMLNSRVPLSEALSVIYESFTGSIQEAANLLRQTIERGESLHAAMALAGTRYFPEAVVAIIKTGSQGGDLGYAIREAARFEKELDQVKRESTKGIFSALGGFLIGVATLLTSTMYVAPQIMESSFIQAAGADLDLGWINLMADVATWVAGLAVALLTFFLGLTYLVRPFAPGAVDRFTLRLPFYKDLVLAKTNYIVLFGLAVLLKAGLRVEEALFLSIDSAPRGELRNDLARAHKAVVGGSNKPWPMVMTMLHPTDKAALATAQDRKQTAGTIEELALQYQTLYRHRMESFVPAMQAFAAVFLSVAGFVLFAVTVIPLMQTSSAIMKML